MRRRRARDSVPSSYFSKTLLVFEMPCRINMQVNLLIALVTLGFALEAQVQRSTPTFAGTWQLNIAMSDFGESTVTYAQDPSGKMRFTAMGQSYAFRVDGQEYPSLFGGTSAWKQIDGRTWKIAIKQDGKLLNTTTITLSADGNTQTTKETGPKPTGGTYLRTTIYARADLNSNGLVGSWKTKNPPRMPRLVELAPSGTDGMSIRFPDDKEVCDAKFDGRDYPVTGPIAQPAMTLALRRTGPNSFDVTGKQHGKPILQIAFRLSGDGKNLTQSGSMTGAAEKFAAVYDRQ